jgi:hypothetical protein
MTWNDVLDRIMEMPEDRREEKAIFFAEDGDVIYEIDEKEEIKMEDYPFDCNAGNDDTGTTFVLIP